VPDFLEQKQREILAQLEKLKPAVDEYTRLQAASEALASLNGASVKTTTTTTTTAKAPVTRGRKRPGRPRGSTNRASKATATATATRTATAVKTRKKAARGKGGRPKGSGARAAQTIAAVRAQPGITIAEIASKLGIKPNYLYRVMPVLQKEGTIKKKGKGWHPAS
jgi:CRP-like cAMP-binding protein